MGLSVFNKNTAALVFLGLLVALLLKGSTAGVLNKDSLEKKIQYTEISHFEHGRVLQEGNNGSRNLAATVRVDPLNKLKKYRGGYNISNKHYWASTVFTGKYGYSIAALWLLAGVVYAGFLVIALCCCKKQRKPHRSSRSRHCNLPPLVLGFLFAFFVIVASCVVLGASARFYSRAKTLRKIVIGAAENASTSIYSITGSIRSLQENVQIPDSSGLLNSTANSLNEGAADIERQARKNKRLFNLALNILFATTTAVISLNLIAILVMSVSGFLRLRKALYVFIILCWIFTVLCWLFFGLYFFAEKFTGDTCTAAAQFQQDPRGSSLSSILPCDDLKSIKPVLHETRKGIHEFINEVNANLSSNPALSQVRICNPFSGEPNYNYRPENCSSGTIQIGEIPGLLQRFACSGNGNGTCQQGQFISASDYRMVVALTSSIQDLIRSIPATERLADCQMVKEAVNELLSKQCKPIKKCVRMTWAALVALSIAMVLLVLIWITEAYHDIHSHSSDGSVKPESTENATLNNESKTGVNKSVEA